MLTRPGKFPRRSPSFAPFRLGSLQHGLFTLEGHRDAGFPVHPGLPVSLLAKFSTGNRDLDIESGIEITIFNGKIHYKWPFSIAMLVYQRVYILIDIDIYRYLIIIYHINPPYSSLLIPILYWLVVVTFSLSLAVERSEPCSQLASFSN